MTLFFMFLAFDRVDLYGLSFKENISIKLNGFFWVDGWKMPMRWTESSDNGFKRF
jgi:hypothetical protein